MLTVCQCRYAVAYLSFGIASEVVLEIVVQIIGCSHLSVDNEFQVVTDATARSIDAVFVVQEGNEVRCRVDSVAIGERLAVQVAIDAGTCLTAALFGFTVEHQTFGASVGFDGLVVVDGIDVDECALVRVANVFGNGKGK